MMYRFVVAVLLCVPAASICSEDQHVNCSQSCFKPSESNSKGTSRHDCTLPSCSYDEPRRKCLPGLFCDGIKCKCGHYPYNIIKCDEDDGTSKVLHCYYATFDEEKNVTLVGPCIYSCGDDNDDIDSIYRSLTQNSSVCSSFNRAGALCGRCLPEHYPLAYSFNLTCIKCPHVGWNWGRYIMAAYLPLTIFIFLIFFFKINAITSNLHPVLWYSQALSMPPMSRILLLSMRTEQKYLNLLKIVLSFHGVWNFDFFRPFYSDICLGIGFLPTLALDYVIAVYPLLLMAITYLLINLHDKNNRVIVIMWKPFRILFSFFKRNWNIKSSLIDSFATFFLLSNIKFLSVTFDLLIPVPLYKLHKDGYNVTFGLYSAGDMKYFGKEHLPYAILAIIVCIIFVILPIALLSLYPLAFFQKCLNKFQIRWHILHTFMDSFTGCYKDGTEPGTRDCRWFAALFLFARFVCFIIYGVSHTSIYPPLSAIFYMLLVLLIINIQPFKPQVSHYSKINAIFFTFLSINMITLTGFDTATTKFQQFVPVFYFLVCITGIIPILYILALIFHWILSRGKCVARLVNRTRTWRSGYSSLVEKDSIEDARDCDKLNSFSQ